MNAAFALLAANALSLSCVVDPPRNVVLAEEGVTSKVIGLPPEMNQWKFDLAITDKKDETEVQLSWPGDPIRAGNALAAMPIGENAFSFISLHSGPCLFTETACMFMYTVSKQRDGSADILIQPSAITSEPGRDGNRPFQVFMKGRCMPKGKAS